MKYSEALRQIAEWISVPRDDPSDTVGGPRCRFAVNKKFSDDELTRIESRFEFKLPKAYREFLKMIGSGVFYDVSSRPEIDIELRRIDDICEMISTMSDLPREEVFSRYLPIGMDRTSGKALVLASGDIAGTLFEVGSLPEKWGDLELKNERGESFEGWICNVVLSASG